MLETDHARVTYPVSAEAFASEVAAEFESIRANVIDEVGYEPSQIFTILIRDPMSDSNGMAIPFQRRPKLELWVTPPDASSAIGHYDTWSRLLVVHEMAHQVHLLRPTRNGFEGIFQRILGIGPVAWKSPRWVAEGYATVVEGRLTAFGRPNGDYRALFLRTLAREGRFPTYQELDGSERYAGGAYAYMVGSDFLEWLEERKGRGSLRDLWARMSSRQTRSFDNAFEGVFGDSPQTLYALYMVQMTRDAVTLSEQMPAATEPWAELSGAVGQVDVDVSAGRATAVVVKNRRAKLVVWELAPDEEAGIKWQERIDAMLEADPEDVAPDLPTSFPPERVGTRNRRLARPSAPRFMPDGQVLFSGYQADATGRIRPDLYAWNPDTGRERRLTRGLDLFEAVPEMSGTSVVALQGRYGTTEVVRVDLDSGAVTPLTDAQGRAVLKSPALSPDGLQVAYAAHRGDGWKVELLTLASGEVRVLTMPKQATAFAPSFSPDGASVLATVARAGLWEAWRLPITDGVPELLASPPGGALGPVATGDGDLLYASLTSDGYNVHRVPLAVQEEVPQPSATLVTRSIPPSEVPVTERAALPTAAPYGLGRFSMRPIIGGAIGAGTATAVVGGSIGDLVDRHQLLVMGGMRNDNGIDALSAHYQTRAIPYVDVDIHGTFMREVLVDTRMDRVGGQLGVSHTERLPAGKWGLSLDGLVDTSLGDDTTGVRTAANARTFVSVVGRKRGALGLALHAQGDLGQTDGQGWARFQAGGTVHWGRGFQLALTGERGLSSTTAAIDRYRLGGVETGLLTSGMQANRVFSGLFAPTAKDGQQFAMLRVEARTFITPFAEQFWVWDDDMSDSASTAVGLKVRRQFDGNPLIGFPNGEFIGGVGCRLRTAGNGWDDAPCQELSNYAGWVEFNWTP
ncbi:MAG: hypothetical protein ACJAZO_002839 [Myxococcota bacterium]